MYKIIYFEISGHCNAKCSWCTTGRNFGKLDISKKFIDPDDFKRAIDYLLNIELINKDTKIALFNWGEPFLHKKLNDILRFLSSLDFKIVLSTNGSKVPKYEPDLFRNIETMIYSMPGFSQASYDKIHRINFQTVRNNIARIEEYLKESKWNLVEQLSFHVYQFNLGEIFPAKLYFEEKGIKFYPYYANISDFRLAKQFMEGSLPRNVFDQLSKELFLHYLDDYKQIAPADYYCPQYSQLTLDEFCNLLTCCVVTKNEENYAIGSVFDLTADQIKKLKLSQNVCIKCREHGLDYWAHNPKTPEFYADFLALEKENRHLAENVAQKEGTIRELLYSNSWRLTSPLRRSRNYVTKIFNKTTT